MNVRCFRRASRVSLALPPRAIQARTMQTSASLASSSSSSSSDGSVASPPLQSLGVGETCSFLPLNARGCRAPRSCASCLEIAGCMIDVVGECVNWAVYDLNKDYQRAIESKLVIVNATLAQRPRVRTMQTWQFVAGTVQYCRPDDVMCRVCTGANFWRSNVSLPDTRFCLGDDGACVCIDACERHWYFQSECIRRTSRPSMIATPAPTILLSPYGHASDPIVDSLWRGLLAMVAVTVVLVVVLLRRRCAAERVFLGRQAEARRARRHTRSRELGVNPLTLTGWETHRRDLIEKEKASRVVDGNDRNDTATLEAVSERVVSPRATDDASAAYVRLDDRGSSTSNPSVSVPPPRGVSFARYNQATPARQPLEPLTIERHGNSA